ncbi:MAG: PEP-CTERM sorting domain-containing protein [Luteolibacter sp.]
MPLLCGCLFLSGTAAKAAVTITFEQVGADVVATTSGSISAGWSTNGNQLSSTGGTAILSNIAVRAQTGGSRWTATDDFWTYTATSAPTSFIGGTATGDTFGYSSGNNFYTPTGVAEGEAFTPNTTMTWTGQTLDSLFGNNPPYTPTVVFTLDNADTISIVAVPEPSTIALVSGVMVIGLVMIRRRNRAV